jgi:hypothetical protein
MPAGVAGRHAGFFDDRSVGHEDAPFVPPDQWPVDKEQAGRQRLLQDAGEAAPDQLGVGAGTDTGVCVEEETSQDLGWGARVPGYPLAHRFLRLFAEAREGGLQTGGAGQVRIIADGCAFGVVGG